ncbi:MAG TPA: hypothetical protein PKM63_21890 [Panacibacter sp.]|nr:hypothetical protein [Panacibacter sp.]HNP46965.1 hypothetical protein [Panacibacter sp.]
MAAKNKNHQKAKPAKADVQGEPAASTAAAPLPDVAGVDAPAPDNVADAPAPEVGADAPAPDAGTDAPGSDDGADAPAPDADEVYVSELMESYRKAYPGEQLFLMTSDKQVFLKGNKSDANAHQEWLNKQSGVADKLRSFELPA